MPEVKLKLDALCTHYQSSLGRTLEHLVDQHIRALPESERAFIQGLADAAFAQVQAAQAGAGLAAAIPTYQFSRLCFNRDFIEALGADDRFRVETPIGVFEFSKAEFYRAFPEVVRSGRYQRVGSYQYRTLPRKAEQFRV